MRPASTGEGSFLVRFDRVRSDRGTSSAGPRAALGSPFDSGIGSGLLFSQGGDWSIPTPTSPVARAWISRSGQALKHGLLVRFVMERERNVGDAVTETVMQTVTVTQTVAGRRRRRTVPSTISRKTTEKAKLYLCSRGLYAADGPSREPAGRGTPGDAATRCGVRVRLQGLHDILGPTVLMRHGRRARQGTFLPARVLQLHLETHGDARPHADPPSPHRRVRVALEGVRVEFRDRLDRVLNEPLRPLVRSQVRASHAGSPVGQVPRRDGRQDERDYRRGTRDRGRQRQPPVHPLAQRDGPAVHHQGSLGRRGVSQL